MPRKGKAAARALMGQHRMKLRIEMEDLMRKWFAITADQALGFYAAAEKNARKSVIEERVRDILAELERPLDREA